MLLSLEEECRTCPDAGGAIPPAGEAWEGQVVQEEANHRGDASL